MLQVVDYEVLNLNKSITNMVLVASFGNNFMKVGGYSKE